MGLDRSPHYNHSGFTDLVITGLCGLRPPRRRHPGDVRPLVDGTVPSFLLENVPYHGHAVTIQWDADGKRYGRGTGLASCGWTARGGSARRPLGRRDVPPGSAGRRARDDAARHGGQRRPGTDFPAVSASSDPDANAWQAVDGRAYFFPELVRGWTPRETGESWLAVDYGLPTAVSKVVLSPYEDGTTKSPEGFSIQAWTGATWREVAKGGPLTGNTGTAITLGPVRTMRLRVVFRHAKPMRLVELETY